jgi:hypothetical protein
MARIRTTTSLPRRPSRTICPIPVRISSKLGTSRFSQRRHAWPLVTMAASGWLTSWAIETVSSPMVVRRATRASSSRISTKPVCLVGPDSVCAQRRCR